MASSPDDREELLPGDPLSSSQLERVIRRAAELQTARESLPDRLDDSEVMQIGEEVGLDAAFVHRALLEIRAEALVPARREERKLPLRLWGAAHIQASRVVVGDALTVHDQLGRYLRTAESLRAVRDRPEHSVWEPASDLASQLRRSLDFGGHGFELAKARRVEVSIQQLEPGRSLVTLSVDLSNERAEHAWGWIIGGGVTGAIGTASVVLGAGLPLLLVAPLAVGGGIAGGSALAGRTFRSRRERVELVMAGLLDRLERGGELPRDRSSIVQKITGFLEGIDAK